MKFSNSLVFAPLALALPTELAKLQEPPAGSICFVFARGSTEPSPLGLLIGPPMQSALKAKYKNIITVPVPYAASLMTNVNTARTDATSIKKGIEAFQTAAKKCQVIIAGGYSQGAAVMHNVVGAQTTLDPSIRKRIAGVALFGDTRNKQDNGHILNFPEDRSKVWCNPNDGVCGGNLVVNMGHMSYGSGTIKEAATWLQSRVQSYVAASSGEVSRGEEVVGTGESED